MKIKKLKFEQILKLHLLKSRVYEQFIKKNNYLVGLTLTQIINNLKKSLQIVFQYHQSEKRILFIGVPKKLEVKINRLTNHMAVPYNHNLQGILSNNTNKFEIKKENNQNLFKLKSNDFLPKLFKKPDLIVLFCSNKAQNIIQESYSSKTMLVILDSSKNFNDNWSNNFDNVPGNNEINDLRSICDKNLYSISLNFLFKIIKRTPKSTKKFII